MKNLYKLFLPLFVFIASSCGNGWLDLQPGNSIDSNNAIEKLSDAEAALIGIYNAMQSTDYYGSRMQYYADVIGDDLQSNGDTKRCATFYRYAYTAENAPRSLWEQPYYIIRLANNVLAKIDKIEVTEAQKNRKDNVKGTALFFRALAHFDITRVYGYPYLKDNGASWGASIVTEPTDYSTKPSRNTVADCYNKLIIPDLKQACELLIATKSDATQGKINKWGAMLLLSRVYLYMGDNTNALATATECISGAENAKYALIKNENYYSDWLTKYNSEGLFEVVNLITDNAGNDGLPYLYWDRGYDDIIITQSFYEALSSDKNDVRLELLTKGTKAPAKKTYPCYILKYNNTVDNDVRSSNITVLRLSEAYLNAAEAAVKLGDNANAIKYLEPIVQRANPDNTIVGLTITLERVLEERRKELFGEGHRAFDLLRNGLKIERVGKGHSAVLPDYAKVITWDDFRSILPVPKYEIDANPQIAAQQNPGW